MTNGGLQDMTGISTDEKTEHDGRPLKSLLTSSMTADEISLWATSVFYNFSKINGLENLERDIAYLLKSKSSMHFRPLWFRANKLVSGYICEEPEPFIADEDGGTVLQDIAVLQSALDVLTDMQTRKEQTLLIVPVRASTLYDRKMKDMFKIYCEYKIGAMNRHLVFMLTGLEERALKPPDIEHIRSFSIYCRSMIVDTPVRSHDPGKYVNIRPHAFGFSARKFRSEQEYFDYIPGYADACDKIGVKSFLLNADTPSVMSAAIAAGFDYLEGSAIMPVEARPRHAECLGINKVYKNILFGGH